MGDPAAVYRLPSVMEGGRVFSGWVGNQFNGVVLGSSPAGFLEPAEAFVEFMAARTVCNDCLLDRTPYLADSTFGYSTGRLRARRTPRPRATSC
jgi:hypothetical protein